MKKIICLFFLISFSLQLIFAQYDGFDFENYIAGQQLVCQDSINWTTFNLTPCDLVEDPYISTNFAFSGSNSVLIAPDNNLIKPLGNQTFSLWHIGFMIYVPSGKSGYFYLMSGFTPDPYEWAMECYFEPGGIGYLNAGGLNTALFYYTYDMWHYVMLRINLDSDVAQFWLDKNLVHSWQWSLGPFGGGCAMNLAANGFYNWSSPPHEMHIDDYFYTSWCLACTAPLPPSNIIVETIFNPNPQVNLNWQDNSSDEYMFDIYRKQGMPNDPPPYNLIGSVAFDSTQFIDKSVIPESTYTYKVYAYNIYGTSESNTATITVPIPVELISFTAEVDDNVVTLFWQTATETNNSGFEILRSTQNDNSIWDRIGFIEGKGTTTEIQSYLFADNPESGKYKYRLKQIDFDGTFAYSPEVEAEVKAPNVFSLEQNYPNPFNPITKIKYTIPEDVRSEKQEVILKVYDVLGNEVATLVNEEQEPGVYEIEFSTSSGIRNLVSGIYFYQLKVGSFIETKKMILLK